MTSPSSSEDSSYPLPRGKGAKPPAGSQSGASRDMGEVLAVATRLVRALAGDPGLLNSLMRVAVAPPSSAPERTKTMPASHKLAADLKKYRPEEDCKKEGRDDPLVPLGVVKNISGLGKTRIYELVREGGFPAPYKPGGSATRWSLKEVEDWRRSLRPAR